MPTRTTTKTAARKPAASAPRKSAKPSVAPTDAGEIKSAEGKGTPRTRSHAAPPPAPSTITARARSQAATAAKAAEPAPAPPVPKPVVETVSLIDEKKPRPKRPEGQPRPTHSFLPPISRIRPPEAPPPPAPAPVKAEPTVVETPAALAPTAP